MAIRPLVFTGFPVQAPPAPAPSTPVAGPVSARGSPFAAGLTRAYLSASYGFFPFPAAGGPVDWHPHGSRMPLALPWFTVRRWHTPWPPWPPVPPYAASGPRPPLPPPLPPWLPGFPYGSDGSHPSLVSPSAASPQSLSPCPSVAPNSSRPLLGHPWDLACR